MAQKTLECKIAHYMCFIHGCCSVYQFILDVHVRYIDTVHCSLLPGNQILISKYLVRRGGVEQWIRMATDYKIVVVPETGGTRPCIEYPQCLGLQLLFVHMPTIFYIPLIVL